MRKLPLPQAGSNSLIFQIRYKSFWSFLFLSAIVWVGLFLNLGYFFGNISYVKDHFSLILLTIIFISLIPIISAFIQSKMKVRVSKKGLVHEEDQRNNES
jgi:membrane-associated protein